MAILDTTLDPRAPSFLDNRSTALAAVSRLEAAHAQARDGGGEREVTRHHARGKLLPRERIELMIDRDTALLELATTWGAPPGAGVVTAIGVIEQIECMLIANDATIRSSGLSADGRHKAVRAIGLAEVYAMPVVLLWETETAVEDLPAPAGVPVLCGAFGSGGAPLAITNHVIAPRGLADIHADLLAEDERDMLRLIREAVRRLCPPVGRPAATGVAPRHEVEDLLAVHRADLDEILARVLDNSDFEELCPHRGAAVITGFGAVHGHRAAILGGGPVDADSLNKALQLVREADVAGVPVIALPAQASAHLAPGAASLGAVETELGRALAGGRQVALSPTGALPSWATTNPGPRFRWAGDGAVGHTGFDGVIDPRDTRTVLGICLSVMRGRP